MFAFLLVSSEIENIHRSLRLRRQGLIVFVQIRNSGRVETTPGDTLFLALGDNVNLYSALLYTQFAIEGKTSTSSCLSLIFTEPQETKTNLHYDVTQFPFYRQAERCEKTVGTSSRVEHLPLYFQIFLDIISLK